MTGPERAKQAIGLLDLTSLNDNDDEARIEKLCRRAVTPIGPVAAVCVWPRFVATARRLLAGSGVRIAAVANFPAGSPDIAGAAAQARAIVDLGGDEVDVVFPYNSWLNGDFETGTRLVAAARAACGTGVLLKVILETGCLWRTETIGAVAGTAIAAGADFIKTSTGRSAISATPEAARVMLRAIKDARADCGLKVSGGIRDAASATRYLDLAERMMGSGWISPRTFRFGASGVLDNLLAVAAGGTEAAGRHGY